MPSDEPAKSAMPSLPKPRFARWPVRAAMSLPPRRA